MSKKKKIIAVLAILLAIFVSFLGGQTFSKYITEVTGKGNAPIANWNFVVNESEETTQTIDLASTLNNATLLGNKIAPGTNGSFTITIDGTGSEVGIQYDLEIKNETQKPKNLIFMYQGQTYQNIKEIFKKTSAIIDANAAEKTRQITIDWKWPFEIGETPEDKLKNNQQDTNDATNIENYTFDIVVTGKQVVPYAEA